MINTSQRGPILVQQTLPTNFDIVNSLRRTSDVENTIDAVAVAANLQVSQGRSCQMVTIVQSARMHHMTEATGTGQSTGTGQTSRKN